MENNQVSQLSLTTAFCRAYHSKHDQPKIFDDFLASSFFTSEECDLRVQKIVQGMQAFYPERFASLTDQKAALTAFMQTLSATALTVSRSRYTEDALDDAVSQGVRQYVILGAGLDTFAYRRRDLADRLQVFEIDHPSTQAYKREQIEKLGWETPANLHYLPVDFAKDDLETVLTQCAAYDPQTPVFFSWLGVVYYLNQNAVFETLQALSIIAAAGSSIVFDYIETAAMKDQSVRAQIGRQTAKQVGEPVQTLLDASALVEQLAGAGLRLRENLSPSDIENRYFKDRPDQYHAAGNTYFAQATVE